MLRPRERRIGEVFDMKVLRRSVEVNVMERIKNQYMKEWESSGSLLD